MQTRPRPTCVQSLVKIDQSVWFLSRSHTQTNISRHPYVRGYSSLRSHTHFCECELILFVALVLFDLATLVCRGTRRDGTPGVLRSCSPLIRATPCYLLYTHHQCQWVGRHSRVTSVVSSQVSRGSWSSRTTLHPMFFTATVSSSSYFVAWIYWRKTYLL